MATAMISGLVIDGRPGRSILVIEPSSAQCERLREQGVEAMMQADSRLADADVVIWAVKPQDLSQAFQQARAHLGTPLHISIAAGLPIEVLSQWFESVRVVRAMPNTGALVGAGVTGMAAAEGVSCDDKVVAERILASTGYCFWVDNDERLDAVTAVSGSGPAYVFHFLAAFQRAAEERGFDPAMARQLVMKVTEGALGQADRGDDFETLQMRVTSKKGTTEAALNVLDARQTSRAIVDAVNAAYVRAGEMARTLSS